MSSRDDQIGVASRETCDIGLIDSGKRANSQFKVTLQTSLETKPIWSSNLEISTPKSIGNKVDKLTVIKATRNIMGAFYRNNYIE